MVYILQVVCYDHDDTGDNDLIGELETDVNQLKSAVDQQVQFKKLTITFKQNGSMSKCLVYWHASISIQRRTV